MKAPRLIARSFASFRQVGCVGEDPQGSGPEIDRDLAKSPKPVHHPEHGSSCHSSRVKGAAAGGDECRP